MHRGTKLVFSSVYHPQSDGQTEVVNGTIEMYLHYFTGDHTMEWVQWISWAEYAYNTGYHSSSKATPLKLFMGDWCQTPLLLSETF